MGENVKFRGEEVKAGTCENMYYARYEDFKKHVESGEISGGQVVRLDRSEMLELVRYSKDFSLTDEQNEVIKRAAKGYNIEL